MSEDVPERMELEFDTVARWTRDAVAELGPEHAVPAACRGSASPAGLDWLVRACGLRDGTRLADVGGGVGGPAAYARASAGAVPVVVDPMPDACAAATGMLGVPAVVGDGARLPLATGSVPVCWCLGVLCTVEDKAALLDELHRVLAPGGALGLLVFTADTERPAGAPDGNHFPTAARTRTLLAGSGFDLVRERTTGTLPPAPADWQEKIAEVEGVLTRVHGDDPRFAAAEDQSARIGRLIGDGTVVGYLMHATAR
ncbi:methyltransferase domain-containing protein [Pseudonocardia nantongensis]|uniref:methyltransferase domain-containing protein n=1 Tax=Pseudonocardia nantongensis TaxID=1181885 RepID=UPI00397B5C3A